jgi:hypothetical protein
MAATITASGTWTPLGVDFRAMAKGPAVAGGQPPPNVPHADSMQLEQLKNTDFPELTQFLQAMADGYGIGYQAAKALFHAIWTATINREAPMVTSGTSRVYGTGPGA